MTFGSPAQKWLRIGMDAQGRRSPVEEQLDGSNGADGGDDAA